MIRVLLADDDVLVRSGLRALLDAEEDITVVGEAADGREAVERAHGLQPDVVLMDVRMPRLDGVQATREIVSWPRRPRVLVLTTFDLDEVVDDALDAGADGFLLKRATGTTDRRHPDGGRRGRPGRACRDPAAAGPPTPPGEPPTATG